MIEWWDSEFFGNYDPGLTTPPIAPLRSPPPQGGRGAFGLPGGSYLPADPRIPPSDPCKGAPLLSKEGGPRLSVVGWFGAVRTSLGDRLHGSNSKLPPPAGRRPPLPSAAADSPAGRWPPIPPQPVTVGGSWPPNPLPTLPPRKSGTLRLADTRPPPPDERSTTRSGLLSLLAGE